MLILHIYNLSFLFYNVIKQLIAIDKKIRNGRLGKRDRYFMENFKEKLNEYLAPFWKMKRIVNETVTFVGKDDVAELMYRPDEIISVTDYRLEKIFKLEKDYFAKGKQITRTDNSLIPFWTKEEYYAKDYAIYKIAANKRICEEMGGLRYLKYGEGDTFTSKQIAVTYCTKDEWTGKIPQGKTHKFNHTISSLKNKSDLIFLFYGDSITTGCNASGTNMGGDIPPYMPPFDTMICEYLMEKYGSKIQRINTAVGGMNTRWGIDNFAERVLSYSPDFLVIAFGMNDPVTPSEEYRTMIKEMVERMHSHNPETEIMLVSPMLPNYEADESWFANQAYFYRDLLELEKDYGYVATADVTTIHRHLISVGKRYRDMTANNINHPNDFLIRLYAQVILTTLLGEEFDI